MSERPAFLRKLAYLALVALLILPLSWLGMPATSGTENRPGSAGGRLARLRTQNRLSQANLGEIDPSSVAIKLVTLGLHNVAGLFLWTKSNNYAMKQDWTRLSATLEQQIKLQPHYIGPWIYQGWNLSYNVSAEFDDYRDRYHWVMRGIDFLEDGTRYNENEPRLRWEIGWFTGYKIGRADEHKQFRRLFRQDDEFHRDRPPALRDNWLVGKESYLKAQDMVANEGVTVKGTSPLIFYSGPPMWQINYATAIESEGVFGEAARVAWDTAAREWAEYGRREFPTFEGETFRLTDLEALLAKQADLVKKIEAIDPGLRARLAEERRAALSDVQRAALEKPSTSRTKDEANAAREAARSLLVTDRDLVERMPDSRRDEAKSLLDELVKNSELVRRVEQSRLPVNYEYWDMRCRAERTENALESRRIAYEGDQAFLEGLDMETARVAYEKALSLWRKVLDEFPRLLEDSVTGEEIVDVIHRYQESLKRLDQPLPEDYFGLNEVIKLHEGTRIKSD